MKRNLFSLVLLFAMLGAAAMAFRDSQAGFLRLKDTARRPGSAPGSYRALRVQRSVSRVPVRSPVIIRQVAPADPAGPVDRKGRSWDWIELENVSGEALNLAGYSLSDRPANARKWVFPGLVLPAGGRMILWASGRDGLDPARFLDSSTARDAKNWRSISEANAEACAHVWRNNDPVGRQENLRPEQRLVFPLRVEGADTVSLWLSCRAIGERPAVLACDVAGATVLARVKPSDTYHSVQIVNPDRADGHWVLDAGDVEVGVGLLSGEVRVSGLGVLPLDAAFGEGANDVHLTFRLAGKGEFVGLFSPRGVSLDYVDAPPLEPGQAFRRRSRVRGDFEIGPAAPLAKAVTRPPELRFREGGLMSRAVVEMVPADAADRIYFTCDGSVPTRDSRRYFEPLGLDSNTVVRARAFRDGALPGATADATWWKDAVGPLPVMSVIMDPSDLADPELGMYAQSLARGPMTERPCHLTLIMPDGSVQHARAGVRIQGRSSRKYSCKKGLRFSLRPRYGEEAWPGRLFDAPGPEKVTSFVALGRRLMQNVIGYEVMEAAGIQAPRRQPVMLYVNGRSFGIYILLDDVSDPGYLEQAFGHLDLDVIKEKTADSLKWGSWEAFDQTWNRLYMAARKSLESVSVKDVAALVDPDYFSRWVAAVHYLSLDDTQGYFVQDRRKAAPAWSFIPWDLDNAFWEMKSPIFVPNRIRGRVFNAMWQSADYRLNSYAAEFQKLLNHRFKQDYWAGRVRYYADLFRAYRDREYEGLVNQMGEKVLRWPRDEVMREDTDLFDHAEQLMTGRTDYFFDVLAQETGAGPACEVRVASPDGPVRLLIDGYPEETPYAGKYLPGSRLEMAAAEPFVLNIGGREVRAREFVTNVTEALEIRVR